LPYVLFKRPHKETLKTVDAKLNNFPKPVFPTIPSLPGPALQFNGPFEEIQKEKSANLSAVYVPHNYENQPINYDHPPSHQQIKNQTETSISSKFPNWTPTVVPRLLGNTNQNTPTRSTTKTDSNEPQQPTQIELDSVHNVALYAIKNSRDPKTQVARFEPYPELPMSQISNTVSHCTVSTSEQQPLLPNAQNPFVNTRGNTHNTETGSFALNP